MAAMYPLFFGILFITVCSDMDFVHRSVKTTILSTPVRSVESRSRIIRIATNELGVREATGRNDGKRVEAYLAYTGLDKGHAWCAAFVSWCYAQAGLSAPRNPWSPALFPNAKTYCRSGACHRTSVIARIQKADIFGVYSVGVGRINHVGLIKEQQGKYIVTIEGNVANKVLSKRRHLSAVYAIADWVGND